MKSKEVVIVGAGITGLSTAYYLVRNGVKDIVLIEKSFPGSGSTGRCGTGIRQQFTTREHIVLMRESVKLWREWENSLPISIHFRQGGYLWLLETEKELTDFKEYVKMQNLFGVESRIIDPYEAKQIVPDLNTKSILGASWCPTDGNAYPFDTVEALKLALRNNGVEIHPFEEVIGIETNSNRVECVVTNKDKYYTHLVVNAAGFGANRIAKMVGFSLPLKLYRHQIAVSEPVKVFLDPMIVKRELYFTQTYRGRIIGGTDLNETETNNLESTEKFLEKYAQELLSVMPVLSSLNVMRQWAGFYVVSPDSHPILGGTPVSGFLVAAGFSGHGFMLGPVTGKLMAMYILHGTMYLPEANNLGLDRFEKGKLINERAVIG